VVSAKLPGRRHACRLVIPSGLRPGDRFQLSIPHVRRNSSSSSSSTSRTGTDVPQTDRSHGESALTDHSSTRLDDETEAFIAALPEEMREQVRQERAAQTATLGEMASSNSHTNNNQTPRPQLFSFTIPHDAIAGTTVQTQGPNGEAVSVYIPEGVQAGEVIGVPLS
jgi:hypothetical protein